jgi:hypothetical protein
MACPVGVPQLDFLYCKFYFEDPMKGEVVCFGVYAAGGGVQGCGALSVFDDADAV